FWVRFSQTAAVFFIAFVIGWFIKAHYTDKTESTWLEVSVPTGHMTQLKLSDSSKVWLNSESTFRYPSDFSDERRVLLSGEAYFEVAPKRESPFIVETDCLSARVLGTRFNVRAYKEDSEIETTLMEGKVALNNNGTQNTRTVLYSGDQAKMNKLNNELEIRQVEHPQAKTIAWIKGRYEFHNEPLNEILNFASRWYDIKFVVKDKELQDTRFTGVMRREYPPEKLLELIKKTEEIVTKRKNDKIIIKYQ
ncbi:MAG: FecR family protein, partial [Bacteroidales bacterium]